MHLDTSFSPPPSSTVTLPDPKQNLHFSAHSITIQTRLVKNLPTLELSNSEERKKFMWKRFVNLTWLLSQFISQFSEIVSNRHNFSTINLTKLTQLMWFLKSAHFDNLKKEITPFCCFSLLKGDNCYLNRRNCITKYTFTLCGVELQPLMC